MNTLPTLFICHLHVSHFAHGTGKHVLCVADVKNCSIDWDSLPFTDLTFHVTDCFSISSLQCDCGLLRRLTLIWVIFRHSRVLEIHEPTGPQACLSTNPRITTPRIHESTIHEFTNPQSTNPRIHESIYPQIHKSTSQSYYLGVPPTPHCMLPTAFCTLYQKH